MKWVRVIRDQCDAPAEIRSFLLVMATYADNEGACWPSLQRLADNLGIHVTSAKRRRNRAVDLGWLVIDRPGRWKGASTHYQLQAKGSVAVPLPSQQRGASKAAKGERGRSPEGSVDAPRTIRKFQEGALGAPSLEGRQAQNYQRRQLARAIREAKTPFHKERFIATFVREYGHLYGRAA